MGFKLDSPDYNVFNEYIKSLDSSSRSKAYSILENTKKGIDLYLKYGLESLAIERMQIHFDRHVSNKGERVHVNSETYISIMHKIYAQIRHLSYVNI